MAVLLFMSCSIAMAHAGEYDLAAYLARVERENLNLRLSRNDLDTAHETTAQARSALLPSIAAQGGYTRNLADIDQSTAVAADVPPGTNTTGGTAPLIYEDQDSNYDNEYLMALSVTQKIFAPDAIASLMQAKKGEEISRTTYEATRRNILNSAKKLYAQTQLANQVLEVMEAAEQTAKENYQNAERRFEAGLSAELDLLMAESTWKSSIPETAEARRNAQIALISFKTLAGIPNDEEVVLTENNDEIPTLPEQYDLRDVLAKRPDYEATLLSKEVADIAQKAAMASFLPSVDASLTYAKGLYRGYTSSSDSSDYDSFQLGVTVTVPLSTGGYRLSMTKSAKLAQNEANIAIAQKYNDIEQELLSLRLTLEEAYQRIESAGASESVAQRALAMAQTSYANGLGTQYAVNDALDQYQQARLGVYHALFEYRAAYYDWELATGKNY
ncbi:TolC family protein [Sediminispirochaeta bajacaliforniensis]|uniref:TolC family protein n=1 Tax=Sediminispirochaeta bajacaliforniensis TaxID=148 RepID=UPI001FE0715B|nr:TolC family protein [Sediminispirochaeta bajacaliforniensis]